MAVRKRATKAKDGEQLMPIRMSFDEQLKNEVDEEADLWSISVSELCRNCVRYVLRLSIEERRNIIFPLPKRRR